MKKYRITQLLNTKRSDSTKPVALSDFPKQAVASKRAKSRNKHKSIWTKK